ncbi:integrase, catalytic region, zinc finger, CCHC-type containing protein [Tanacetum coccineum]|uniref:Integrase, catalytic region, zinc finger, CCHC-type containing protein n=1 Tax=Tanacetum coccineum TaxID=301880 RepID=A0ABQ4ZWP3_9ASTR
MAINVLTILDIRPNGDALRKCILKGPYTPTFVTTPAVPATEDSPAVPEQTTVETVTNMTPENRAHYESEKEAIHLILTGIGDEIYSTVDAFITSQEMWKLMNSVLREWPSNLTHVALVLLLKHLQDPIINQSKSHKSYAPTSKASLPTRSHAATDTKQRDSQPITSPLSASASEKTVILNSSEGQRYAKENCSHWPNYMVKDTRVPNADSGNDAEPLEQNDQHDVECDDERVALANLIANLKLDVDENKKIQKQLKKANATLTQELTECKSILAETSRTLGESNSIRDSCLVALQNKQTEFERYKAFNDRTVDYDKLERKLNETLGLLAQKDIDIQEGLKVKAYEISVVQAKHDELVKQSLLTRSHYEGLVKEKTKVITDLKLREDKDIDKMISMEHQIKFLNEIVYKRGQSIQTIQIISSRNIFNSSNLSHAKAVTNSTWYMASKTVTSQLRLHQLALSKKDVVIGYQTEVCPGSTRYTWTLFLRSKDETPEVLKDFLTMIQRNLQALVISVRTDRGTEFLNKTLNAFFKEEGIEQSNSTPRTPEQNGVVERRNHARSLSCSNDAFGF